MQSHNNKCIKLVFVAALMIMLCSFVSAIDINYQNFSFTIAAVLQPNPFNITGGATYNWRYLILPRWGYISNFTLTINKITPIYCNQENANQTSYCGGLNTGNYSFGNTTNWIAETMSKATDNNYSSYLVSNYSTWTGPTADFLVNYTTQSFFQLNESKWFVWTAVSGPAVVTYNSVPPDSCQKNPLEFKISCINSVTCTGYCKNTTGSWKTLFNDGGFGWIAEEGMNWSYPIQNSTISISANWTSPKTNITPNGYTLPMNLTILNGILDDNCTCTGCSKTDDSCITQLGFYADTTLNISVYTEPYSFGTSNWLDIYAFNNTGGRYYNITLYYNGSYTNDSRIYRGNYNRSPQNFTVKVMDYLGYYRAINISVNVSKERVTRNITLTPYSIDNCSTNTYHILDGRFYKEDHPLVNTTTSYEISAGVGNLGTYNFSITGNNYNFSVCIDGDYTVHFGEMYIKYILGDVTHKYYYYDEDFNPNSIHNLNLFILNTTTGVSELDGVVRNTHTYDYLPDVYVSLHRYYASDNTWRVVQMDKSDAFGQLYFNIRENIYDYYLTFEHLGTEIYDTGTLKFVCSGGVCVLTFTVSPYEETMAMVNMHPTYNYNNNTGIITITWDDTSMTVDNVTVDVTLLAPTSTTICYMNSNNYTGQFSCNVTGYHGTIFVTAREYGSRSAIIAEYIILPLKLLGGFLSDQGLTEDATFWAGGIIATVSIAGALISPILAIVFAIFGLMIVSYLGISSMITMAFVIPACIVGIIISLLMRNG